MSTPYHFRLFAPWFPAVLVLGLTGCFEKDDPLGSEVENEVSARIFLADGSPASGASVKIYSVNHNPQEPAHAVIFSTRTDSQGRYAVDSVPRGEYNVLSDLNGEVAYQDSVFLSGGKGALQSDTLRAPGELFGRVRIQPNHDPRTVTLQVLGTNMFANVDDSGGFVLKGLAEGIYRVRLVTTLPEYTPSFVTLRFRSGRTDTLPDPLALTYTGIPVVDGVRVAFDTLNGVAMLAWKPVKYSALSEFLVFRNSAMAFTPSVVPIARTRDTFFTDTLYRTERGPMDTVGQKLEYRVAVRNKSDEVGKSYGFVVANAAPPGAVRTHMSLSLAGTMGGQASIGDTVSISLAYTNYSRKQHRIVWRVDNAEGPLREALAPYRSGGDVVRLHWGFPGRRRVSVSVQDEAGDLWRDSILIDVIQDVPSPFKSADKEVGAFANDTVRLHGQDKDLFGRIVKWEWDFGAKGLFVPSSGPDTFLVAPPSGSIACILRVTDDDGNQPVDTLWIRVTDRPEFVSLPAGTYLGADGKTHFVDAYRIQKFEVTRGLYTAIMGSDPSFFKERLDLPMESVSMLNVIDFCNRLSDMEKRKRAYVVVSGNLILQASDGYRLPTREEWEYAARAGSDARYWERPDPDSLDRTTWYSVNSGGKTHPVGLKAPNDFGLYDMNGNVSEMANLKTYGTSMTYSYSIGSNWAETYSIYGPDQLIRTNPNSVHDKDKTIGFRLVLPGP